jgi:hypothetical protein
MGQSETRGEISCGGPGLSRWDASLIKDTKISELSVQFRWEVHNLLNLANFFSIPNNTLNGGGLGTITKTPDVAAGRAQEYELRAEVYFLSEYI